MRAVAWAAEPRCAPTLLCRAPPPCRWCLCASRWREALEAGVAPPVVLEACHERSLDFVTLDQLTANQLPAEQPVGAAPEVELK